MKCPYCGNEMQTGVLSGNDRSQITWKSDDKETSLFDKLMGNGKLTAANYGAASFSVAANFCDACKKMIIETDVAK